MKKDDLPGEGYGEKPNIDKTTLQASQLDMRLLIDGVKHYAIFTIDKNRRVISWNEGAQILFGYTAQEITGRLSDVLFTPEDIQSCIPEKEIESALANGHAGDDRWHKRKDGSVVYVSGVTTVLNQGSDSASFIKIARDWTGQKRIEEALLKADRHKSEFLATLAHELRNPLAAINSALEVLRQTEDDHGRMQNQVTIERQTDLMIHLVNDLLDISRISLGKIKITKHPLDITEAINLAIESSRHIVKGFNHALTVSLPHEPIVVEGDMTRLSQVFLNILVNAAKYTPPGGEITLSAFRENSEVVIRVCDTGLGIPAHMLSNIFQMFEQVQDRSEYPQAGLGIGLSVVRQLVQMHGGHVQAYSEGQNKGSEFVVHLPIYHNQQLSNGNGKMTSNQKTPPPVTSRRILLIDDNSDAVDMMEILFKKKGYSVQKAYNGKTGIEVAVDFDPEIILLDLGLPDISGYEVLKALQGKLGKRLYIALSGWGQAEDLRRSKEAGFQHHLVKPVDIKSIEKLFSE